MTFQPIEQFSGHVDRASLEIQVKAMYQEVALHPDHKFHFEMGRALTERLGYPTADLDNIPEEAIESFAGVGYFFHLGNPQPGETVLDLGSGSGTDVFFAARRVGENGRVIGIDMTDAQLEKAKNLRDRGGYTQVDFVKGYIEDLPVNDGFADLVISNGVINLSANKRSVFQEAARVLRPGGRLAIADIVTEAQLPGTVTCNADLWAACIGGARREDEYTALINNAGLRVVTVQNNNAYHFLSDSAQGAVRKWGVKSISLLAVKDA